MDEDEYVERVDAIGRAFSPAAPITDRDLFAGRKAQLRTLASVAVQRGQHALIYGERGVGKTSLARVTQNLLPDPVVTSYYVCNSEDSFKSIWNGVFGEITLLTQEPRLGFGSSPRNVLQSATELLGGRLTPHSVSRALAAISESVPIVVLVDEFDRPVDARVRTLIADTIKILADRSIAATVVLVGVADTVDELVSGHASIQRSLVQVQMPRMTDAELREIVRRGVRAVAMEAQPKFVDAVAELSQGLPHYTHLLGQYGTMRAVEAGRSVVKRADFEDALTDALDAASQSVRERYHRATQSNRETLYKEVLLACAVAEKDDLGSFGAPDVREKLRQITGKAYDIPAFAVHLKNFSSEGARGGILQRIGTTRRFRYRFRDPLLPPYIVIKGRIEKLV
ncbi:AAA family ATPase [Allokutzneria oryzae]|uniref:AAA family ATPase n=1 Tax=Allokutzneria oryzae TaxID=1378989 RepID=A0ABV6A198_9PSEU